MNDPIQLTGSVIHTGTTRFSVKGEDGSHSFVHITFTHGKCHARCTKGLCAAQLQAKKKIPRFTVISHTPDLCVYMKCIVDNLEHIKEHFPFHFNSTNEVVTADEDSSELVNTEDAGLKPSTDAHFDTRTGMWNYPALSTHIPNEMMDPHLVKHTELRNKFATSGQLEQNTGLRFYQLKPSCLDCNGERRRCDIIVLLIRKDR